MYNIINECILYIISALPACTAFAFTTPHNDVVYMRSMGDQALHLVIWWHEPSYTFTRKRLNFVHISPVFDWLSTLITPLYSTSHPPVLQW